MCQTSFRPATKHDFETLCQLYYDFHEYHVCGVPNRLRSLGERDKWDRTRFREALAGFTSRLVSERSSGE